MDRKRQVEAAFLEWINSFPFPNEVASVKDLNDGLRIWEILRDIDSAYFVGELPEGPSDTGEWSKRWQNLKHITKSLMFYIRDVCGQPLPEDPSLGDLKMIAYNADTAERLIKPGLERGDYFTSDTDYTLQLVKLVLVAAINSPKATGYIAKMPTLSFPTQAFLKESIEELQNTTNAASDSDIPSTPTPSSPPPPPQIDAELIFEERYGKVMADNERLAQENQDVRKNVRDLRDRLAHLQENNAVLQESLTAAEDALQLHASAEATNGVLSLKPLQLRIQDQEDIIAGQEATISEYQTSTEALQKTIERTHVSSAKLQKLQDEIDELKVERDGLAKKANTVDKYKQKLQASQDLEKDNELLRAEIDDIRQNARNTTDDQEQLDILRLKIKEYEGILPGVERDHHELQMMKRQLEIDNATLAERWEAANEQHIRDLETIEELQVEIHNAESGALPPFGAAGGLDTELAKPAEKDSELQVASLALLFSRFLNKSRKTRISELESEITQLTMDAQEADKKTPKTAETSSKFLLKTLATLELVKSAARKRSEGPKPGSTEHLEQLIANCADEIISGADALAKRTEELETQNAVIKDLQARLKLAEESVSVPNTADQLASLQELENLKRENRLVASAFHDMAGRLQMNGVGLQRRTEPPRSWMNKVRRQLEQPAMVRSR
ncbi:Hook-related protein family [Lasallia pustulata]|uniref:Hook-related protein family n=1 Tax=Lasallia pustulata TaxID=136370 RepID=A0A1W5CTZ9_9LECA|nr:Hook-related protein family [Lasallia pustulata]